MASDNPFVPPDFPRSFQSAGMDANSKHVEMREAYRAGDYERGDEIMNSITPQERHASNLLDEKFGGAPGGSTFSRGEIFVRNEPNKPVTGRESEG